jgi:hypothetical protein
VTIGIELDEIALYDNIPAVCLIITAERFEGDKSLKIFNNPK